MQLAGGVSLVAVILLIIHGSNGIPAAEVGEPDLEARLANEKVWEAISYGFVVDPESPSYLARGDRIFEVKDVSKYIAISSNPRMSMSFKYSDSEHTAASNVASSFSVEGSYGAFSAAASMEVSKSTSSSVKTVRMDSMIKALKFEVGAKNDFRNFPEKFLTDSFKRAVKELSFEKIEENIGVFYAKSMDLGGEIRKSYTMQATEDDTEQSVSAELKASYGGAMLGVSAQASVGVSSRESNKESKMKVEWTAKGGNTMLWLGKTFSDSGDTSVASIQGQWADSISDSNLFPFNYDLGLVWELVQAVDKKKGDDFKKYLQDKWTRNRNAFVPSKFLPRPPSKAPTGCTQWNSWSNGNTRGHVLRHTCPKGKVVEKLQWREQSWYGLIDVQMVCGGGATFRFTHNHRGSFNNEKACTSRYQYGFIGIRGREQNGYGLINTYMQCAGGSAWTTSNGNMRGGWNGAKMCRPGWVVSGLEVREQHGYGIINMRPVCTELMVKNKWREDLRCGPNFRLEDGSEAQCNPNDKDGYVCCSRGGWCGKTADHCCSNCVNYSNC